MTFKTLWIVAWLGAGVLLQDLPARSQMAGTTAQASSAPARASGAGHPSGAQRAFGAGRADTTATVARSRAAPATAVARAAGRAADPGDVDETGAVTLNFDGADLVEVIHVFARHLRFNFTVDEDVRGAVTIFSGQPVRRADLLPIFHELLRIHGAVAIKRGDLYRITTVAKGLGAASPARGREAGFAMRIAPVRFFPAASMKALLTPFLGAGGTILDHARGNYLVVVDLPSNIRRLVEIMELIDVEVFAGTRMDLYRPRSAAAQDLARELSAAMGLFAAAEMQGDTFAARFLPLPRINRLLVVAYSESAWRYVQRWLERLDVASRTPGRKVYIRPVENGDAVALARVLNQLYSPRTRAAAQPKPPPRRGGLGDLPEFPAGETDGALGAARFGRDPARSLVHSVSSVAVAGAGTDRFGTDFASGAGPPGAPALWSGSARPAPEPWRFPRPAAPDEGSGAFQHREETRAAPDLRWAATEGVGALNGSIGVTDEGVATVGGGRAGPDEGNGAAAGDMRVVAEPATNSLVILATRREFLRLEDILAKLDVVPRQVLMEVLVAEVALTDEFALGVEHALSKGGFAAPAAEESAPGAPGDVGFQALDSGFTSIVDAGRDFRVFVNALMQDARVKVLSSPHLLAVDNRPARIRVGREQPVATGMVVSQEAQATTTTIQFKNVGRILTIVPRVSDAGMVNLQVRVEVSDVGERVVVGSQTFDAFNVRDAETTAVLHDGQTLVIGGIITDNLRKTRVGVPLLMDLPVLGQLFRTDLERADRTELVILITPRVIRNQAQGAAVTERFLAKVGAVRRELEERWKNEPRREPGPSPER